MEWFSLLQHAVAEDQSKFSDAIRLYRTDDENYASDKKSLPMNYFCLSLGKMEASDRWVFDVFYLIL